MNLGVFINSELHFGGAYQYEYKILSILKKYHSDEKKINIIYYSNNINVAASYKKLGFNIKIIKENILQKINRIGLSNPIYFEVLNRFNLRFSKIETILQDDNIDLVYFLYPSSLSLSIINIPYIFTLFDLGHLQSMQFPEVANNRVFEKRENLYSKSLKKAYKIIVDSNFNKELVSNKYNLEISRVEVLKYLPNIRVIKDDENIDVKNKYNLKNDYIFYPAQFWAHKNHIYILKAIKILRDKKNIDVDVIFSGSDKGNLSYVMKFAKAIKVDDLIHYIGFAPNEEIPSLYKQSLALVMPTYLGPTNIPPLEAFAYQTPVCYSDMTSFREQVGDAAFFMDLKDPNSLAEILDLLKKNKTFKNDKILKGEQILNNWNEEDFYRKLLKIFNEFSYFRETWSRPDIN
jgi:glycosyltransferase involved in cell wall biosynthesis